MAVAAIQITCYDRNGEIVKRVTSADAGTVEDPEGNGNSTGTDDQGDSSQTGDNTQSGGGDDQGGGNSSITPGEGD